MSEKVVIVGLDGATFDVIRPMAARGWLPNLARLMERGLQADLRSTIQPITPQAWTTFLTGKNAGRHGLYDFVRRRRGTYDLEFVNASHRTGASFFGYASRMGRRAGAVGVPFTFPPEALQGFMLSGIDAPAEDERAVYPREAYGEIRERFGQYHVHLASPVGRTRDEARFWRDIVTEDANRTDVTLYLRERFPVDLLMTVYSNTDRVQHQYLTESFLRSLRNGGADARRNLVARTYENTDRELGRLLEAVDEKETLVLVVSDHGSGPIRSVFLLNRWLETQGFLTYRASGGLGLRGVERARTLAKRLLPRKVKGLLKSFAAPVRDRVETFRYFSTIDWQRTRAYGFGMYGNIFLNVRGREPSGIVSEREVDGVCDEIIARLMDLQGPDGEGRIIETVHRKEDLYHGPCTEGAPDLIIQWKDYAYYTSSQPGREEGGLFRPPGRIDSSDFDHVGTHRLDGILIAAGPGVRRGASLQGTRLADLAPTILLALGLPIPEDMEGRVLTDMFSLDFLTGRRPEYANAVGDGEAGAEAVAYDAEEARKVEERLRNLGYL